MPAGRPDQAVRRTKPKKGARGGNMVSPTKARGPGGRAPCSCGATSGQADPPAGRGVAPVVGICFTCAASARFSRGFPQVESRKFGRSPCSSSTGRGKSRRRELHSGHGRVRHAEGQDGSRGDAEGRRHHGRRRRRAGADRRGGRRVRGHGARARAGGHPPRRRASRAWPIRRRSRRSRRPCPSRSWPSAASATSPRRRSSRSSRSTTSTSPRS